jgi:16S rRNA (cytosine967-C5)-methyltransferase
VERLPGFAEGLWSVQDESAMAAARLLAPKAGERILDVCAAPGGKTCHLAELSGDAAIITACDISETRLQRVRENVTRLSLQNVKLQLVSRDGHDLPSGPFDAVLVDVPCSNTGVLGRRPEARWRFHEAELQELIPLQTRLLLNACERLVGGGRVVYSTCSLEPEENRGVVDAVLKALPGLQLVTEQVHAAGRPADGAYQALLVAH